MGTGTGTAIEDQHHGVEENADAVWYEQIQNGAWRTDEGGEWDHEQWVTEALEDLVPVTQRTRGKKKRSSKQQSSHLARGDELVCDIMLSKTLYRHAAK